MCKKGMYFKWVCCPRRDPKLKTATLWSKQKAYTHAYTHKHTLIMPWAFGSEVLAGSDELLHCYGWLQVSTTFCLLPSHPSQMWQKVSEVIKSSYRHFREPQLQLNTHTCTHSARVKVQRQSCSSYHVWGPKLKLSVSGVGKILCMCICVCWSNTGAARDTEEETGLLPFELDLEKKAVFPSCQISLTVMPPSCSQHKLVWWKLWAIHLFTASVHTIQKFSLHTCLK